MNDLQHELEDRTDAGVLQKEMQKKRDNELTNLKKQIDAEAANHESQMGQLRTKHAQLANELNEQLETLKRNKAVSGRASGYCSNVTFTPDFGMVFHRYV